MAAARVACFAPGAPCGHPSRRRAAGIRPSHQPVRPPEGGRLHAGQGQGVADRHHAVGRRAAVLDAAGRAGLAQPLAARVHGPRPVAAVGAASRLCRDLGADRAAFVALSDLQAGAALRLQPDDASSVAGRSAQVDAGGCHHRPAAGGPDSLAHGLDRAAVVALGLGRLDGLQSAADVDFPQLYRTAVQQVRAAGR